MRVNAGLLADSLGWALLHSIWQIALIAALIAVALRFLPRHHAQLRYLIAYGGLSASLLAFLATWGISYRTLATTAPVVGNMPSVEGFAALIQMLGQTTWLVSLAWALGFSWLGIRYVQALRATNRLRREGIAPVPAEWEARFRLWIERLGADSAATILQSSRITTPLTIGSLKPIVLVPTGFFLRLPMDQAEAILVHEIAHICRQDYLMGLVQAMICNIFFFHPAIGWISRQIDLEREFACDARVVRETGNTQALAKGLSKVALESRDMLPGFAMAANGNRSPIVDRITRLRERPFRRESGSTLPAAALTMVFAACLTIAVSAEAAFENAPPESDSDKGDAERAAATPLEDTTGTAAQNNDAARTAHETARSADHASRSGAENADKYRNRGARNGERSRARNAEPVAPASWSISFTDPENVIPKAIGRIAWSAAQTSAPNLFQSAVYQPDVEEHFDEQIAADEDRCDDKEAGDERRDHEMARREARLERAEAARERAQEREEARRERELERLEARLEREAEAREAELERIMERVEEQVAGAETFASAETHRALERARSAAASARSRSERARAVVDHSRVRQRNRVPTPPEPPVAPVAPVITISFATPTQQGTFRLTPTG
ncbi:M56 family metallopeptidase [Parasphingopyxis marina]|uniref:M56 family metallopeptidase n=1 Tax=Parasphingopyxis marina TaxID=2761622 RepID=A0A842I0N3_9SPHN|nr:M56 family metallopeptidase [Parasphingopyxis marina]MBC2778243.1 M56 family metallopeptidase [Parasphingopyxis marina]